MGRERAARAEPNAARSAPERRAPTPYRASVQDSAALQRNPQSPPLPHPRDVARTPTAATANGRVLLSAATLMRLQRLAGNLGVRRLIGSTRRPAPGRRASLRPVQRWAEGEHQQAGDIGSGHRRYTFGEKGDITEKPLGPEQADAGWGKAPPKPFVLSHGDLNMLGDWFDLDDRAVYRAPDGQTFSDSLFVLARRPSPSPGQTVGTVDEIIFAIKDNRPNDPRFDAKAGGEWAGIQFSDEVKTRTKDRYFRLASKNTKHFQSPQASGPVGRSYVELHEDAIARAITAGQQGKGLGEALAREAAAQHFLADYFSAGHLRTPIGSVRDYWSAKYPLFFDNLKKKIALDVARFINDNETGLATVFGTVNQIYDVVLGTVLEKTASMPPFTFGDVVGRVGHDIDNSRGLWVVNDLGDRWITYGDSHLHEKTPAGVENRTPAMIALSIRLGIQDIEHAHQIGTMSPGPLDPTQMLARVRAMTKGPAAAGATYGPLQVVPRLGASPDADSVQNWRVGSVEELWKLQVRTDLPGTWGEGITDNLINGEIGKELTALATKFPATQGKAGQTLHPRQAYLNGFVGQLKANPYDGLRGIIHFDPSVGQTGRNEDDMVMEDLTGENTDRAGMTDAQLKGMTTQQRAKYVTALVSGWGSVDESEGEQVIRLFRTAPSAERKEIYRLVEGHVWNGDWVSGAFVDDDEIYNGLDDAQLSTLRDVINGR